MENPGAGMNAVGEERESSMASQSRERLGALRCIRALIVIELVYKVFKIVAITGILLYKRKEECEAHLKLFLMVYVFITVARTVIFVHKNGRFFEIERIPEYRENADVALFSNFVEALLLFWYLIGFSWLQECRNCKFTNPLLYYVSTLIVIFGFLTFIAPLLAIILLIFLVAFVRPKLPKRVYKSEEDVPDDTYHCTICFENYVPGTHLQYLPCGHHFHQVCIQEWLDVKDTCPLCKRNISLLHDLIDPHEESV
jgi:cation transporter-like permease